MPVAAPLAFMPRRGIPVARIHSLAHAARPLCHAAVRPIIVAQPVARRVAMHRPRSAPKTVLARPTIPVPSTVRPRTTAEFRAGPAFAPAAFFPAHSSFTPRFIPRSSDSGPFAATLPHLRSRSFSRVLARQRLASHFAPARALRRTRRYGRRLGPNRGFGRRASRTLALGTVLPTLGPHLVEFFFRDVPVPIHIQIRELETRTPRAPGL